MKLVFFDVHDWEEESLKEFFKNDELALIKEPLSFENADVGMGAEVISVFTDSKITKELIDRWRDKLKLIVTRSTGFDHIDMQAVKEMGIKVCNVPHYGENTVAEHTFALILTLSRKIYESVERTEKGKFDLDDLRGFDLKGKTLGIFGLGNIGMHVARIAKGFEMNVLAVKRDPEPELAKELGLEFVSGLDELLDRSHIVTLHVPLSDQTWHLINKDNIKKFKKGAILINTARGGLVETEALLQALQEGILSGVGLDVLEEEKPLREEAHLLSSQDKGRADWEVLVANHVLIARDDVIFTGHNAFNSYEAVKRILDTTVENVKAYMEGRDQNLV